MSDPLASADCAIGRPAISNMPPASTEKDLRNERLEIISFDECCVVW